MPDKPAEPHPLREGSDLEQEVYRIIHHVRWLLEATSWDEMFKVLLKFPDLLSPRASNWLTGIQGSMALRGAQAELRTIRHRLQILALCRKYGIGAVRSDPSMRQDTIPSSKVGEMIPPNLATIYKDATTLEQQYELNGNPELLERFFTKRLELLAHPDFRFVSDEFRWEALNDAAIAHRSRFAVGGDERDLEQSIELSERLVKEASVDYHRFPGYLCNLGNAFQQAHEASGEISTLQMAIQYFERSIALSPSEISTIDNLNNALSLRFNALGDRRDLDRAVELQNGVVLRSDKSSQSHAKYLSHLGHLLSDRFALDGNERDLKRAIEVELESVALTSEASRALPGYLNNLSIGLSRRYEFAGNLADLDLAISLQEKAVSLTAETSINFPSRLNVLGLGLLSRSGIKNDESEWARSISYLERAVALTKDGSHRKASFRHNLAVALSARPYRPQRLGQENAAGFIRSRFGKVPQPKRKRADLDRILELNRQAVESTDENAPEYPDYLSTYATSFEIRYELFHDRRDLEHEIELLGKAIAKAGDAHPHSPSYYFSLAMAQSFEKRYLLESASSFKKACVLGLAKSPAVALGAARKWGSLAMEKEDLPTAVEAYDFAAKAIRRLVRSQAARGDKEKWISEIQGLPDEIAFVHAKMGNAKRAVAILEDGRALLIDEQLELNGLIKGRNILDSDNDSGQELHTFEWILEAAGNSTIVYIAVGRTCSVAFIVDRRIEGNVKIVWLPSLNQRKLRELFHGPDDDPKIGGYLGAYGPWRSNSTHPAKRRGWLKTLDQTLEWLWEVVIGPLESHLRAVTCKELVLILPGILSLFPLHAAWTKDRTSITGRKYLCDKFNVKYTATMKFLASTRKDESNAGRAPRLLFVNEPRPSSAGALTLSQLECATAAGYFDESVVLRHEKATRQAVLDLISSFNVCHFACHGLASLGDPLRAGLLMANDEVLRLSDVLSIGRLRSRLVVLSACETGLSGTELPDEVVSLPSGFAACGVAGVVASFWVVTELQTYLILSRFYSDWLGAKNGEPGIALSDAQKWLRDSTNSMKVEFVNSVIARLSKGSEEHRLAVSLRNHLNKLSKEKRDFCHPFNWAQFGFFGS